MMPRAMQEGVTAPPATPCPTWIARVPTSPNARAIPPIARTKRANGDVPPVVSGGVSASLSLVALEAGGALTRSPVTPPGEDAPGRAWAPGSRRGTHRSGRWRGGSSRLVLGRHRRSGVVLRPDLGVLAVVDDLLQPRVPCRHEGGARRGERERVFLVRVDRVRLDRDPLGLQVVDRPLEPCGSLLAADGVAGLQLIRAGDVG